MKIYVISKWSTGGLSRFFEQLNKLNKIFPLFFILFKPPKDLYRYKKLNWKVIYPCLNLKSDSLFLLPIKMFFFIKDLSFLSFYFFIFYIKKKEKIILFLCDPYSLVIGGVIKLLKPKEVKVIFLANLDYSIYLETRGKFIRKIIYHSFRFFLKKIDYVIFTSYYMKKNFLKFFKIKEINNKLIYHGIRPHPNIGKKIPSKKNFVILYVGRLDKQKDLTTIIRAFNLALKKVPNSKLFIVGEGPDKKKLKNFVHNLNLENKVKFFKWQKNVNKFYKKADLFCFASFYEGFSYVILEAMSYGLPIISTDTPFGPREILNNGKYGILVPMKNPKKMAYEIQKLLKDNELYYYYSKMSHIRSKFFTEKKMLDKFKKVFGTI